MTANASSGRHRRSTGRKPPRASANGSQHEPADRRAQEHQRARRDVAHRDPDEQVRDAPDDAHRGEHRPGAPAHRPRHDVQPRRDDGLAIFGRPVRRSSRPGRAGTTARTRHSVRVQTVSLTWQHAGELAGVLARRQRGAACRPAAARAHARAVRLRGGDPRDAVLAVAAGREVVGDRLLQRARPGAVDRALRTRRLPAVREERAAPDPRPSAARAGREPLLRHDALHDDAASSCCGCSCGTATSTARCARRWRGRRWSACSCS